MKIGGWGMAQGVIAFFSRRYAPLAARSLRERNSGEINFEGDIIKRTAAARSRWNRISGW